MKRFNEVYKKNSELDEIFINKYGNDKDYVKKNKLELICEISELSNESRVFKYWSIKKADMDKVKEEYADTITMILCFFNYLNIKLDYDLVLPNDNLDILDLFSKVYELAIKFYNDTSIDTIKELFNYDLLLGYKLGLTDEIIINSCLRKINIINERLNGEY